MPIELVPQSAPDAKEAVRLRIKRMPRPDGMLQCNRCGCRVSLTTVAGAIVKNGRKQGGTVLKKDVCAECWRQGIFVSMLPELQPVK
jgi:hypothetical protein